MLKNKLVSDGKQIFFHFFENFMRSVTGNENIVSMLLQYVSPITVVHCMKAMDIVL